MKLCFLLASYNKFGGVERVVINLANLLSKNKDVHITLFSYCDDGENGPFMIDDSIELKHIYNRPIPLHRGFIPAVRNLNKDIRLSNYDILVGCSSMYFPLAVCGTLFLFFSKHPRPREPTLLCRFLRNAFFELQTCFMGTFSFFS